VEPCRFLRWPSLRLQAGSPVLLLEWPVTIVGFGVPGLGAVFGIEKLKYSIKSIYNISECGDLRAEVLVEQCVSRDHIEQ
jgi:hypothetical protein